MTTLNTAQLLQKHLTSLRNGVARGRKPAGSVPVIAKYEALRCTTDSALWAEFCAANRLPKTHTAYHLFNSESAA